MAQEPGAVEQAISRALRDNLATVQRAVGELEQAVSDLVAACASTRAVNALPPLLRAQTASASLAASLEVMARFIAGGLQPGALPLPAQFAAAATAEAAPAEATEAPPAPREAEPAPEPESPPAFEHAAEAPAAEVSPQTAEADMVAEGAPVTPPEAAIEPAPLPEEFPGPAEAPAEPEPVAFHEPEPEPAAVEETVPAEEEFAISSLPPEEQELHRRANRVAKVSMQDIQMLHPEEVAQGRASRDLCARLRDDIDKARREYDRRFGAIQHHPVDYFYHWMVEILGNGDPEALGEYPYPSPVVRR